ncbi:SMP-30/gluconolactonase/LRE family protein [Antrihabitans sp. YC2-6]|uniref:SMP-30/gluconolactonase/LRE family protein n=1 Tax=Antrihabitans sp. YC2-6 TaxID=2799498 RepID=UPI0018F6F473|nr:SMP-30/gluconolactonase/LRE family protein [Antrihabitans sp. YC2-6]MBJ8343633.1 SMP-30/gluconolactonase/LRE family protein [Antrihabitans sp. YC2-6]
MPNIPRLASIVTAALTVLSAFVFTGGGAANAAPICPGAGRGAVVVGRIAGAIEGATVDPGGRMYVTDAAGGRILRIDAPGAAPVQIATVPGAGALAWAPDGALLVGFGDPRILLGDALRPGGVARVDVGTGAVTPIAGGLSAANGMDVARDGTIYATNDFGNLVGRVSPNGAVQADWASLPSANGAVLSSDDAFLYVARTFANPGVSRIPTGNPGAPESVLNLGGAEALSAPDGLTLDARDRPVVPLNLAGQIIRVDAPNQYCVLASGVAMSSVLTYGRGSGGFAEGRLFRGGFDGTILEIPGGFDPGATTAAP